MNDQDTSVRKPQPDDPDSPECAPVSNPQIKMYVQWSDEDEDWCVDDSPAPRPKKKTRPVVVEPASGPHDIVFELRPPRNLDWKFDSPPISATDNVGCPPPDGLSSNQLVNPRLDGKKQVLTVTDLNNDEARLIRYKLHFLNEKGDPLPVCDPVILNGGGGDN
jgi:hypothetical protein